MKYDIGDSVSFRFDYKRDVNNNGSVMYKTNWATRHISRSGVVCGLAHRREGTIISGSRSFDSFGCPDDIPGEMRVSRTREFYLVRQGWLNKPLLVLEKDMSRGFKASLPKLYHSRQSWTPEMRKLVSEDSKTYPRDAKGRWAKYVSPEEGAS